MQWIVSYWVTNTTTWFGCSFKVYICGLLHGFDIVFCKQPTLCYCSEVCKTRAGRTNWWRLNAVAESSAAGIRSENVWNEVAARPNGTIPLSNTPWDILATLAIRKVIGECYV